MATYAGNWVSYGSGGTWRVEVDVTNTTPGTGSTVNVTYQYFVRFTTSISDSTNTINWSDPWGSGGANNSSFNAGSGGGRFAVGGPWTRAHSVSYGTNTNLGFSMYATGMAGGGTGPSSVSFTHVIGPRQPTNPSGVSGGPYVGSISTTSCVVSWGASGNGGGASINGYQLQVLQGSTVVYDNTATSLSRSVTVLTPGVTYTARVRVRNSAGLFSGWSSKTFTTLSGMKVRVGGVWRNAKVWVRVGGTWRQAKVYIRNGGTWKAAK